MTVENNYNYVISYGKSRVPVCRVYARPLSDVPPIPESSFTGRENILFTAEVDVEVFGENFLPSYTVGDNSMVVATDTRKATALLAYLAVTGRPQRRATLAALLWPDTNEQKARGALRRTLSVLRTALGDRWLVSARRQDQQGSDNHKE